MTFRVTNLALENQAIRFAARHNAEIFRFQQQITSGVRLNRPADDPIAFRQVATFDLQFSALTVELANIQATEASLNNSVSQLQEASRLITSAVTAAQQGIQVTERGDREALALEIDGILDQLKSIANSQFNGQFQYGGTASNRPPFEFGGDVIPGGTLSSQYVGSDKNSEVFLGSELAIEQFYNGQSIFTATQREATLVFGATGAAAGTGTDTFVGRTNLLVTHGTTTIAGGSGIVPGASSSSLDTIIGNHQLTLVDTAGDGSSGTVSLNGGTPISFVNPQTDLRVTGPDGESLQIDTTGLIAGFNGNVSVRASGFLSVDNGQSEVAIDFSTNQVVTDSVTGQFVNIDSQDIRRAGTAELEFPGTSDIFQVLLELSEDLRNTREFSNVPYAESIDRRIGELNAHRENVLSFVGEQSTSLRTLESVRFRNEELQLQVQNQASELQATDISEAALRLGNAEALLEYTFAVTAQITSINILDFLR